MGVWTLARVLELDLRDICPFKPFHSSLHPLRPFIIAKLLKKFQTTKHPSPFFCLSHPFLPTKRHGYRTHTQESKKSSRALYLIIKSGEIFAVKGNFIFINFCIDSYALAVCNELCMALEGLVER